MTALARVFWASELPADRAVLRAISGVEARGCARKSATSAATSARSFGVGPRYPRHHRSCRFLRAWELAGVHLFYVEGLPYPSVSMPAPPMLRADLLPVAFLPAWVATAPPTYRDGLLKAFARQWEVDDRFWQGLAAVLADELGLAPGV